MAHKLIRTLLHLANADGNVSGSELALIHKIAVAKGIPMFEVEQIVQNPPQNPEDLQQLTSDEKFEYIYTIILMIKMDGKMDDREIEMCTHYAVALGYQDNILPELMALIKSDHDLSENKEAMKQEIQKFLK